MNLDAELKVGKTGQFDVFADGELVVTRGGNFLTRMLGAGYPETDAVIDALEGLEK